MHTRPITTAEAEQQGLSRRQLERSHELIATGVWMAKRTDGRLHPMRTRVEAHHRARPDKVFTSWAALAMHGLTWWVDEIENISIASEARSRTYPPSARRPNVEKVSSLEMTMQMDPYYPELRVVPVSEALIGALKSLRCEQVSWRVVDISGWSAVDIRAIQLIDAARRLSPRMHLERLEQVASGRLSTRWLRRVWKASDAGAESPMETVLRLIVAGVQVASFVPVWESQVPVYSDATTAADGDSGKRQWVTVLDLYCRALKIALFYDGAHHRENRQFQWDAKIAAFLQANGFTVVRITSDMVRNATSLRTMLMQLVLKILSERQQEGFLGRR